MQKVSKFVISLFFIALSFYATTVQAQFIKSDGKDNIIDEMKDAGDAGTFNTGGSESNPLIAEGVGTIVSAFLGLLGIIFLIMILIGGFNWMTAAGNEDKVTKARQTISRGIVGLIITVAAYVISAFVFRALSDMF